MSLSIVKQALEDTLVPHLTRTSQDRLLHLRRDPQFTTSLLLVADDSTIDPNIRQSALVCLKNVVEDHCQTSNMTDQNSIQVVKSSVLQALCRNAFDKKLAGTLRQIVYILSKRYLLNNWHGFIQTLVKNLSCSVEMQTLYGSLQAMKAIYTVFGESITQQISLSNLCNKTMPTLLCLASKLFQNYNGETALLLNNVLKILSTALCFYLPQIVVSNLHSWMIFLKKILDIQIAEMFHLKKICLRIIFRMYQRHVNSSIAKNKQFAVHFHDKYTRGFVETFLLQILTTDKSVSMQLVRLSLACLSYVYRQHPPSAELIRNYMQSIIRLCLQRHLAAPIHPNDSFIEYNQSLSQDRMHFKQLLLAFIEKDQSNGLFSVLSLLAEYHSRGNTPEKELALAMMVEISNEAEPANQQMLAFILQCIVSLEQENEINKGRVCELIHAYDYIHIPQQQLINVGKAVYSCLTDSHSSQTAIFMKMSATKAFNTLLQYQSIVQFVTPYVRDLLGVYTKLLETDPTVIKGLEELLVKLKHALLPYAEYLIQILVERFDEYQKLYKSQEQNQALHSNDQSDQQTQEENQNYLSSGKACIASIRQILQLAPRLNESTHQRLKVLITYIFVQCQRNHLEQGLNMLNLILHSNGIEIHCKYIHIIHTIIYALIGVPNGCQVTDIIKNICVEPDQDMLENSVGCLRNFLVKSELYHHTDSTNTSILDYCIRIVRCIHQDSSSPYTNQCIVLTIYITIVQYGVGGAVGLVLQDIAKWLGGDSQQFTPIYLQIMLLIVHFHPQININLNNIVPLLLNYWDCFKCDFQLSRLLIGVSDILCHDDVVLKGELVCKLPETIKRICQLRMAPEKQDIMEEEAEEEKLFGQDQNSMVGFVGATKEDLQLQEEEDNDWEDEFNKFYDSPLQKIDQIAYLMQALKGPANHAVDLMDKNMQETLLNYATNAPPKA